MPYFTLFSSSSLFLLFYSFSHPLVCHRPLRKIRPHSTAWNSPWIHGQEQNSHCQKSREEGRVLVASGKSHPGAPWVQPALFFLFYTCHRYTWPLGASGCWACWPPWLFPEWKGKQHPDLLSLPRRLVMNATWWSENRNIGAGRYAKVVRQGLLALD